MENNPLETLTLETLRRRGSAKWKTYPEDVLPLWIAETDTELAEPVASALTEAIRNGDTGYPSSGPYIEAFRSFAQRRWDVSYSSEQIQVAPDVMRGITEAIKLVTDIADTVIISSPVYPPFYEYPSGAGRRVVTASLGADGRLDFEALEESFNLRTIGGAAVYLLCNPQNPTGAVHTREELEKLAELATRYKIRVVSDEIHAPLARREHTFTPYAAIDPRGFSVTSASKAWNVAAAKAGLIIAGEDAVDDLRRLSSEVPRAASHFGVIAQAAAYRDGEPWLDALLAGIDANRTLLGKLLETHTPQVQWTPPEGGYLAWLDFSAYGFDVDQQVGDRREETAKNTTPGESTSTQNPADFLLEHARVALIAGEPFGAESRAYARLNFATSSEVLTEAVTRIGKALASRT